MNRKRICVFGDSIVWGAGIETRVAWVNLFRNYIEKHSQGVPELYDLGIDGNTTDDLLQRFDVEAKSRTPYLIIFAIGINDSCYRGDRSYLVEINRFKQNLSTLYDKAKEYTDNIWFMGLVKGSDEHTVPLARSTTGKCYTKESAKIYNEAIKGFAKDNNVGFVELFDKLGDEDFIDGLHPNESGHKKMFIELMNNIKYN